AAACTGEQEKPDDVSERAAAVGGIPDGDHLVVGERARLAGLAGEPLGAGGFGLPQACEHVGRGESAVYAPFTECARALAQVSGGAGLALILDSDDGGDEVCPGDGGDVLAHEPSEPAAQGAHDRLAIDDVAALEVALVFPALGKQCAQRGASASA